MHAELIDGRNRQFLVIAGMVYGIIDLLNFQQIRGMPEIHCET
jgi:hypothetical protein